MHRPLPLSANGLGAVVPGFRSYNLGDAPMTCVPPGFESFVAMQCPDGSLMPACGAGECGPNNPNLTRAATVDAAFERLKASLLPADATPVDNTNLRWGMVVVAGALLAVLVVFKELK